MNPQDTLNVHSSDGTPEIISWFDDLGSGNEKYRFLSNFYLGDPITLPGMKAVFQTGEHAYAAMKAFGVSADDFVAIVEAPDPQAAKTLGRSIVPRPDWEEVKYDVMATVIRTKFSLIRAEGQMLLDTKDALLIEGTYWEDDVWGVDLQENENAEYANGRNWLGTLLMARRAELRAQQLHGRVTFASHANSLFIR